MTNLQPIITNANLLIGSIEDYTEKFVSDDGKAVASKEAILALHSIIANGFTFYKEVCDTNVGEDIAEIEGAKRVVAEYISKLNVENAQKLTLDVAVQLWQQSKVAIAALACAVLDYTDGLN